MENMVAYRMAARDGPLVFHLGERGVGLEETSSVLHSDTLFSALCLAWRQMGRDLEQILASFPQAGSAKKDGENQAKGPPFLLSSGYPFCGKTYFFPRPLLPLEGVSDQPSIGKTLKKVRFVSKSLFEKILQGQPVGENLFTGAAEKTLRRELLVQSSIAWLTESEARAGLPSNRVLWSEATQPRVTVGRADSRSAVYGAGRVRFAEGCGLYTLVRYNDPAWKKDVEDALEFLSMEGIGGERTVGNGQFRLEKDEGFAMDEPSHPTAYVTLSLFWPDQGDVQSGMLDGAQYGLVPRRGWIASPDGMGLRRPNVRMLSEGSAFRRVPKGCLIDLTPFGENQEPLLPHPVWRYGVGFPVGCRLSKE